MHELKKYAFSANQKVFFCRKFYELHSKPFLRTKTSFARTFLRCPQKIPIFTNQKLFFRTNLSLLPSKATLFHPPLPISTPLNLLFAKNTAVLLISALTPYAVKPERRTDSNHCRRYPENCGFLRCRLPDECWSFWIKLHIDRRFESSPESRGSQTSGVLLVLFVHAKSTKNVPFAGSSEVLQTSKQRTAAAASHRNN